MALGLSELFAKHHVGIETPDGVLNIKADEAFRVLGALQRLVDDGRWETLAFICDEAGKTEDFEEQGASILGHVLPGAQNGLSFAMKALIEKVLVHQDGVLTLQTGGVLAQLREIAEDAGLVPGQGPG